MGICYWHEYEVYPGHPCPECEKENRKKKRSEEIINEIIHAGYERLCELENKEKEN